VFAWQLQTIKMQLKGKVQLGRSVAAAILSVCGGGSLARADEPADTINALKRQNELLNERVKTLEGQLNEKIKAVEEQFDQKVKALEQKRDLDAEAANAKFSEASKATALFKLPEWVTGVKLQSDLRMRYDGVYAPDRDFTTRNRIRPRLRLGGIASLKDDFEIGFRIASTPSVGKDSGGDPLSTNQTFEDNGSRKPIGVDWAFARWTPIHTPLWTGSLSLGKLENPPNYSENIFDVDYTPEGFAEQFSYKAHTNHTLSVYFGQYFLDEIQFGNKDPFLFLEQLRLDSKWGQHIDSAITVSALSIANPESLTTASVPDSNHGNTRDSNGALLNDYQLAIIDASITYHLDGFPLYHGRFPIKLAGEYIHNFGASERNTGFAVGPSFGRVTQTGKVLKGNWEISYRYQHGEGDMNYEELTASDNGAFYRSRPVGEPYGSFRPTFLNGLNLRGHAFRLAYAPFDLLVIDARVWLNEAIEAAKKDDNPEGIRVLVDLVWKF
jgi:hypothetical protein